MAIRRVLIANRGEIAVRIAGACRALGVESVLACSEADRESLAARLVDRVVCIGPGPVVHSYLDPEAMIAAALGTGCDALHPGYGFLAERASFRRLCNEAGVRFIGPSAEAIAAMGDKLTAIRLAREHDVPTVPGCDGLKSAADAAREAQRVGFPVMLKASAGGGGRGMRVVRSPEQIETAFASAAAEAQASFGDGTLYLEQYVERGRHIEVQVFGDAHGEVVHLGERDCSVQRRHQKLIEEAPPPGIAPSLLAQLVDAAKRLADAVGYVGVGTVEFLVAGESFFFLEVNPRLQVEHGVTEVLTGLDLVHLQIRIARGESLAGIAVREHGAAIEARVCAEDPAAGFLPAPGRVARFDPALGPRVRVDAGVAAGSVIPAAFDSLIAKVIASGDTRDEARARLVAALRDLDLVVEGGATNKGYLIELLESDALRAGGVDTGWLDRRGTRGAQPTAWASEALLAAAVLAYQRRRRHARRNFFADPGNAEPSRVPASLGQEIELVHGGLRYALQVLALGAWRYRVHLDGRTAVVCLREGDDHVALLTVGDRTVRVLHDETELGVRVEIEGHAHAFGWQSAGEVPAPTPAMVTALHVAVGDAVVAGQPLGLLEAMKMEIGFTAPVAGTVAEIRVRPGRHVAAGEVLLVIAPAGDDTGARDGMTRLTLPENAAAMSPAHPLDVLDEVRSVLLGYDAEPSRVRELVRALGTLGAAQPGNDAGDAAGRPTSDVHAALARAVILAADVARPFERTPRRTADGRPAPSNRARLRLYLRRVRAGGAGLDDDFLDVLRRALAHHGIRDLTHDDALERALLRLFAAQQPSRARRELLRALLDALARAARHGGDAAAASADGTLAKALEDALARLAGMRDLLGDEIADAALAATSVLFVEPALARRLADAGVALESTLHALETGVGSVTGSSSRGADLAGDALRALAEAPRAGFDRAVALLASNDPRRRSLALSACLHRFLPRITAIETRVDLPGTTRLEARLADGSTVLAAVGERARVVRDAARLLAAACLDRRAARIGALALVVAGTPDDEDGDGGDTLAARIAAGLGHCDDASPPLTVSWMVRGGPDVHWTFVPDGGGYRRDVSLHDVHPSAAARIGLGRLCDFALERVAAPDDVCCFHGRSRTVPDDERVFVLAEVRGRAARDGGTLAEQRAAFECTFQDATRILRSTLATRDPQRRLQWNRLVLVVRPEVCVDQASLQAIVAGLAPATHRLGLERVLVRLPLVDPERPDAGAGDVELVITNVTGRHLDVSARTPRTSPVVPATRYDRKVVEAKRRRLVYPYELVRLLCGGEGADLPPSTFVEHDLDPTSATPRAVPVPDRAPGGKGCAIVFGIVTTPTDQVPEGMRRVLILSDPTIGMGALAAAECDRVCAAIDLAEQLGLPVEWVPISSGARIAMDSGTENLDATARVVRRIVTFTERGGVIHVVVYGTNVGAQSYWNALATMGMRTRGALVMTGQAAMVLTGRKALEASGSVAADDEVGIGGFEHVMGPNGEAHYYAHDLVDAYRTLYEHYRFTYVVPGERAPRPFATTDPPDRAPTEASYGGDASAGFARVGDVFDDATNPGRKRPFAMRAVMRALVDQDGRPPYLERWSAWAGAETAIVWDAHLGGMPVCLIGIESQSVPREGHRPLDGPSAWTGGTLFPQSSKKAARALNAASGVRPAVILANLSGFDGSPESMRNLQLEHGAEIARAVVLFDGPLLFVVVSRYHGGAYVVFSKALNDGLHAAALEGSYASVIGGSAAASVVFAREVRARAATAPEVVAAQQALRAEPTRARQDAYERALEAARLEAQSALAAEFDAIHSVERARRVGSLDAVIAPAAMRAHLIERLRAR